MLYGGYEGLPTGGIAMQNNRCVVHKVRADGHLLDPEIYSVELPVAELDEDTVRSRGSVVHLVAGSVWYQLSLNDLD